MRSLDACIVVGLPASLWALAFLLIACVLVLGSWFVYECFDFVLGLPCFLLWLWLVVRMCRSCCLD